MPQLAPTVILHGIAEELRRRHPTSRFSAYSCFKKSHLYLQRSGFPYERLEAVSDYIADHWSAFGPDLEYLREMEKVYGIPNLWLYVTADRRIDKYTYLDALKMLEGHFRFFTEFFASEHPDAVIGPLPAGMTSYVSYVVSRRMGIRFAPIIAGPHGTVLFIHPDGEIPGLKERYSQYVTSPLGAQAQQRAEAFLEEFRTKSLKLGVIDPNFLKAPRLSFSPIRLWRHLHDYYIVGRGREYNMPNLREEVFLKLAKFGRHQLGRLSHIFESPDNHEDFVLFPLQVTPEASTSVFAPFYIDQVALAENVARSLPVGYRLYVKEHPANVWARPITEYRRLRRIPGVRLIAPHVDSHELIRKAAVVVTISSTVGWEAILYEKPVVVLGNTFIKDFEGAYYVKSLTNLAEVLQHAIKNFRADRERILRYLLAMMDCSYPGRWEFTPEGEDPTNIQLLARAVANEVGLEQRPA